jgi:PAS domain S-box-containing protein
VIIKGRPVDTTLSGSASLADEIRRLSNLVNELEGEFRRQRETLKLQGMSLPPGTLAGLQAIHTDLDTLAIQLEKDRNELAQLRALGQIANLINSTLNLDDVLNGVVQAVIKLTNAERGYLVLRNPATGELEFKVARTIKGQMKEDEFIVSKTIVQDVAETGTPVVTNNAELDKRYESSASVIGYALRSILCVPLKLRGTVTGVIYADNRIRQGLFGEKERELLYAFANQAAVAIENARLFERAQANLSEMTTLKLLMDNVFASIGSGVITTDTQDRITTFNDAAERILSVRREAGLGNSLWTAIPPLTRDFEIRVRNVLVNDALEALETTASFDGKSNLALSIKLSPLKDAEHLTQGVAIVVDDVTELRERSAQIEAVRPYLPPAMIENIHSIDQLGLGGERRETTVMYTDVRSFSSYPPSQSAAEFMQMLNDYLSLAEAQISEQNGVVDKYMGNEVMALFNTQLNPDEEHGYRSVLAALGIARAYHEFYRKSGEPEGVRHYRIGIHTGIATLGNAGSKTRKEFTALGDTVNLAHRLLENAQPGQILISRETFECCRHKLQGLPAIRVIERGQLTVKGRVQPVGIYEVILTP